MGNLCFRDGEGECLKFLMGVKNCHCCTKRSGCDSKNSKENISKLREFKKIEMPTVRHVNVPTEVTASSYCRDFDLQKKMIEKH